MSSIEERLAAMERRMAELETENSQLKKEISASPKVKPWAPVTKDPDEIRQKIERELTPHHRMKIHELARDTMRYGYDQAMIMHGRALPKRGRKKATPVPSTKTKQKD